MTIRITNSKLIKIIQVKRIIFFFGMIVMALLMSFDSPPARQLRINKVVIDPGHGGADPGAIGSRSKEKDITLAISLKVGNYIKENFKDVEVIYTRDKDVAVDIYRRPKIANEVNADLFISIHCNSVSVKSVYGSETFVMGLHRTKQNLEVARLENSAILLEEDYEENYDGFDPGSPEADIIFSLYQNAYLDQSLDLAAKVQQQFCERVGRKDRGVKQAGFLVLYKTTMPAILIETGFISNPREEAFLLSEQGQVYIASAIYRAFKDYKQEYEGSFNIEAQAKKDDNEVVNVENEAVDKNKVFFRVQIISSIKDKAIDAPEFKGLTRIYKYQQNGFYKFAVGSFLSLEEAAEYQKEIQKMGFKDAFVVAFNNGKRISPREAIELIKK